MNSSFTPKLSIALTTYNLELFIRECLDSILSQEVNFSYEIVIGEDASTDNTIHIVKEYQSKYQDVIKIKQRPHNLGYTKNFDLTMQECLGKYIAIFDGDDIMLPGKLQKQVDILDKNLDVVMVGHNTRAFNSNNNNTIRWIKPSIVKPFYTIEDLIKDGSFFANSSKVFRKEAYPKHGINHEIQSIADLAVTIDIVDNRKIAYIWEHLVDYRVHKTSLQQTIKGITDFQDRMIILNDIEKRYGNKYNHLFKNQKAYAHLVYGIDLLHKNLRMEARIEFQKSINFNYKYNINTYFYFLITFFSNRIIRLILSSINSLKRVFK